MPKYLCTPTLPLTQRGRNLPQLRPLQIFIDMFSILTFIQISLSFLIKFQHLHCWPNLMKYGMGERERETKDNLGGNFGSMWRDEQRWSTSGISTTCLYFLMEKERDFSPHLKTNGSWALQTRASISYFLKIAAFPKETTPLKNLRFQIKLPSCSYVPICIQTRCLTLYFYSATDRKFA